MAERAATLAVQGEIAQNPAQLEKWRACQWCDYQDVCGFDPSEGMNGVRRLEKLSQEELVKRLV
ncbi:MAG: hypothetical protein FWF69_02775, partial [Firmicutes bacterium]|nr:hypothetical protein [Bacillota bacterium]